MKRYILGLIGFAALGGAPLLAQSPADVQTVTHRHAVQECDGGSCAATRTVCVPECYTKVTKTTVFSSGCEPFCLCSYSMCRLFNRGNCENGHCEDARTRKFLMKKVVTCEESATKCVPSLAPGCATTGHRLFHAAADPGFVPGSTVVVTPGVADETIPFVGQKMPQAAVSPRYTPRGPE